MTEARYDDDLKARSSGGPRITVMPNQLAPRHINDVDWQISFYGRLRAFGIDRPSTLHRLADAYGAKAIERRIAKDTREQGRYSRLALKLRSRAAMGLRDG